MEGDDPMRLPALVEAFLHRVRSAERGVLMLDYDGTLAPFTAVRHRAVPWPGVTERLDRLQASSTTRLVVVTGRPARAIPPLLGTRIRPEIRGSHGWETWLPAEAAVRLPPLPEAARRALERARDWAEARGGADRVEIKPAGVALHWRGLSDGEWMALLEEAEGAWRPLAESGVLAWHAFDGGVELRVPGRDKGDAVREILAEEPPDTPAAYLGDDATDEDAFAALPPDGLAVLVRTEPRPTNAGTRLAPPADLLRFLDAWNAAAGERS